MAWNSSRPPASNHAMWNMHNWNSATADAYRLTAVARTAAFYHDDDLYRCLNRRNWKRYAAGMPCVCGNGRIIRGTEIHAAADHIKQPILHLTALLTVHEHAETFHYGPHIHACQKHTIPRLLLELAVVDPPAVDGRQAIDDASADCEFRVGGHFREMDRGYGKLFRRPAAADAEIVSAVHAAADCDLAVRVEGQGSMLPVHTFQ